MTEPTLRTSAEMLDRMEALLRRMAKLHIETSIPPGVGGMGGPSVLLYAPIDDYYEARAIVAMLPEPVDPDLIEARKIAADTAFAENVISEGEADQMRAGANDRHTGVIAVLAGIKRGRELASA